MKNKSSLSFAQRTLNWAKNQNLPTWFEATTASTNTAAKNLIVESAFASLYLTEQQTAGRGRGQNNWLDTRTSGQLFSSWVFDIPHPPQPLIAPLTGLALYKCLSKHWHSLFALKAPNDIFMDEKKVAGILIENIQTSQDQHRLIVGIGLNVLAGPDLPTAGCLVDNISSTSLENEWDDFLTDLFFELGTLASLKRNQLSQGERNELLQALNRLSLLTEPYLSVHEDGSLQTKSRLIHWSEI